MRKLSIYLMDERHEYKGSHQMRRRLASADLGVIDAHIVELEARNAELLRAVARLEAPQSSNRFVNDSTDAGGSTVTDTGDGILLTNEWDCDHQHLLGMEPTEWAWKIANDSDDQCECKPDCHEGWHWGTPESRYMSSEEARTEAVIARKASTS